MAKCENLAEIFFKPVFSFPYFPANDPLPVRPSNAAHAPSKALFIPNPPYPSPPKSGKRPPKCATTNPLECPPSFDRQPGKPCGSPDAGLFMYPLQNQSAMNRHSKVQQHRQATTDNPDHQFEGQREMAPPPFQLFASNPPNNQHPGQNGAPKQLMAGPGSGKQIGEVGKNTDTSDEEDRLKKAKINLSERALKFCPNSEIIEPHPEDQDANCHGYTINGDCRTSILGQEVLNQLKESASVAVFVCQGGIAHSGRLDGDNLTHYLKGVGLLETKLGSDEKYGYEDMFRLPEERARLNDYLTEGGLDNEIAECRDALYNAKYVYCKKSNKKKEKEVEEELNNFESAEEEGKLKEWYKNNIERLVQYKGVYTNYCEEKKRQDQGESEEKPLNFEDSKGSVTNGWGEEGRKNRKPYERSIDSEEALNSRLYHSDLASLPEGIYSDSEASDLASLPEGIYSDSEASDLASLEEGIYPDSELSAAQDGIFSDSEESYPGDFIPER